MSAVGESENGKFVSDEDNVDGKGKSNVEVALVELEGEEEHGSGKQEAGGGRRGPKKTKEERSATRQRRGAASKALLAALDEWSELRKQNKALLPEDLILKMKEVLKQDVSLRLEVAGGSGAGRASLKKGAWDYARTANMINRAVENNVEGISLRQDGGLVIEDDIKIVGVVKDPPHSKNAANYMRSQAVDFDKTRPINGPFKVDTVSKPVERPCKIGWFMLPTNVKLDFGKAEEYPGMDIMLGDWKKCGLGPEAHEAFRDRPLFIKIFEKVTADMERLGAFFSVLMQDLQAELKKDENNLKTRIEPIVADLDDVCSIQCNRSAALFYLLCQHVRAHVLDATSLKGFFKNWMRGAHASKVLFEPGITDELNCQVRAGQKPYPELNARARKKREEPKPVGFAPRNGPPGGSFVGNPCGGALLGYEGRQQQGAFGGPPVKAGHFGSFLGPAF